MDSEIPLLEHALNYSIKVFLTHNNKRDERDDRDDDDRHEDDFDDDDDFVIENGYLRF